MVAIVGGFGLKVWADWRTTEAATADREWREAFEPNLPNVNTEHSGFTDDDLLHQRPLLPTDYPKPIRRTDQR